MTTLSIQWLPITASLCLSLALLLAWTLSAIRYMQLSWVKRVFVNYGYLLKSHIDYLMMTGLLAIVYLLLAHYSLAAPAWLVAAACIGSLLNPLGFLILAVKPDLPQKPTHPFGALMSLSFVLTTAGYLGAAWLIANAAWRSI